MVMGEETLETQVVVIGAGPGGYAAAFRAADLGLDVTLVSNEEKLGGVCLLRGCIPTKTLLEAASTIRAVETMKTHGIKYSQREIELETLRKWKDGVIERLVNGVNSLGKLRDINIIYGKASFDSPNRLRLEDSEIRYIAFQHAIIATGSHAVPIDGFPFRPNSRVITSKEALDLVDIPQNLLIVGAGYIGMQIGLIYAALGSHITMVEITESILSGIDSDLVRPVVKKAEKYFDSIYTSTQVIGMEETDTHIKVKFKGKADPIEQSFDRVLVSIGRQPNTENLELENTGVKLDQNGFIIVDDQRRTSEKSIFAVGDVTGHPLLAHKAIYEGKIAADVIAGLPSAFDAIAFPAVVYTDPEIATSGLTEKDALRMGLKVKTSRFPWSASGKALTKGTEDGLTKLIFDEQTQRLLGIGIVGKNAEDLISEGTLAIEMGAVAQDLALTIHPHPTLSETINEAAEAFLGKPIHIMPLKKK